MEVIMKKKRRSIATFLTLLVSMFIILIHSYYPSIKDFTPLQGLEQWNVKTEPGVVGAITCNRSHSSYDLCSISGPTLVDPVAYTLYGLGSNNTSATPVLLKVRPYPRKRDKVAMSNVQELTLTSASPKLRCDFTHHRPALVFSAGGYTGNFYHDFNDGLIPLFVTINSVFSGRDFVLVIANCGDWWAQKYAELLSRFSNHPIINLRRENSTHCFSSSTIGLITHGTMTVNPNLLPHPKTLLDFRTFLKNAYTQGHTGTESVHNKTNVRPRMVLVTRRSLASRVILNQRQITDAAKEIGFDVIVLDPIGVSLGHSFRLIEASHAMIGVHGAGLAHALFLRPGSVFMQVVPIAMEWASKSCYENPGRALGLEYIEYKIEAKESSLLEKYGNSSLVIRDPNAIVKGNWTNMHLYLKTQNLKLDLARFRGYLRKAYEKAKRFMDIEG